MPPRYVIDTCSLTNLQRVYPRDMFPQAWEFIEKLVDEEALVSCEEVFRELHASHAKDDDIARWARKRKAMFLPLSKEIQLSVKEILETHPKLVDHKRSKDQADPFVIATGVKLRATVVTEEKASGGPGKVKIPDVCRALGIQCVSLLEMLRREKFST